MNDGLLIKAHAISWAAVKRLWASCSVLSLTSPRKRRNPGSIGTGRLTTSKFSRIALSTGSSGRRPATFGNRLFVLPQFAVEAAEIFHHRLLLFGGPLVGRQGQHFGDFRIDAVEQDRISRIGDRKPELADRMLFGVEFLFEVKRQNRASRQSDRFGECKCGVMIFTGLTADRPAVAAAGRKRRRSPWRPCNPFGRNRKRRRPTSVLFFGPGFP